VKFSLRLAGQTDDLYQGNQEVDLNTLFTALNNWGPKIVWVFKTPPRETSATKLWHKDAHTLVVAPLCVAPARCRPRALCSSVMHVPAAACTRWATTPGSLAVIEGEPISVTQGTSTRSEAPREAIHALEGRRSTRSKGDHPRAQGR
jgi:hypothetical protein